MSADENLRREIVREVIKAWTKYAPPEQIKTVLKYIQEVTKVEIRAGGKWKSGEGSCTLLLPRDLYMSLKQCFKRLIPHQPTFGDIESDLEMLAREYPKLMPGGYRKGKKPANLSAWQDKRPKKLIIEGE